MKKKNPAARQSNSQVGNSEFQHSDFTPPTRAAQRISQKFGLTETVAALVAALNGIGAAESRTYETN